ncbi:unnamed protein product [Discula destructiva]
MAAPGGSEKAMAMQGPPYAPTTAALGGQPTPAVDNPICAVLLLFYVAAAATNMTIFQINRKRDHKFVFSALLFGFCMARIATLSLRIAWGSHPRNVRLAIAASIFVQAGVLLLFVVNLVFAQRIVRSYHPKPGWSKALGMAFKFLYFCVVAMLIMVIIASVYTFFTLDVATRMKLRDITLVAGTFLAFLAFLPIPITLLALLTRTRSRRRPEKFGIGRHRTKLTLLLATALLLSLGACFRLAVNFTPPRPLTSPAWYHSKPCFYCFNFVIELLVVYAYTISRFDRRFHVPDGSAGPGHYGGQRVMDDNNSDAFSQRRPSAGHRGYYASSVTLAMASFEVNREVDIFGDDGSTVLDSPTMQQWRQSEWEASALEEMKREEASFPIAY